MAATHCAALHRSVGRRRSAAFIHSIATDPAAADPAAADPAATASERGTRMPSLLLCSKCKSASSTPPPRMQPPAVASKKRSSSVEREAAEGEAEGDAGDAPHEPEVVFATEMRVLLRESVEGRCTRQLRLNILVATKTILPHETMGVAAAVVLGQLLAVVDGADVIERYSPLLRSLVGGDDTESNQEEMLYALSVDASSAVRLPKNFLFQLYHGDVLDEPPLLQWWAGEPDTTAGLSHAQQRVLPLHRVAPNRRDRGRGRGRGRGRHCAS